MDYDVAIIGCGPVGAFAANLLGQNGLRTVVVEREREPHPLPRAVHLDHEMMRLFQSAGLIEQVAPDMREADGNLHIGSNHQVIRYIGSIGQPKPFGWASDYFFYQPELESHLRAALSRYAHIDLCLGETFDSLTQDEGGVTLALSSNGVCRQVRARWAIACDGASSRVRKALEIELGDLSFEEPWLVVDAEVDGPVRFPALMGLPENADLQRLSVMMCDPSRPTTVVPGRGNHRRWEFMLLPGEDEREIVDPKRIASLVAPWLAGVPHRIVRAATYRFHGLIAREWRRGRVFLAGDAAHQTPPFFGQGMCHGLRDAANLAWKLALVQSEKAHERLLATYQIERDPHVRRVIDTAIDAGRYICILDRQAAAARDANMREPSELPAPPVIPPLEHGVIAATQGAGERFIQPRLASGALLDDVTGSGWRLFVKDGALAERAHALIEQVLVGLGTTIVDISTLHDGGQLHAWLEKRKADAVIVRPDFYVFGCAAEAGGLQMLAAKLVESLALHHPVHYSEFVA